MTVEVWASASKTGMDTYQHLVTNSVGGGDTRRGYLLFLIPAESKVAFEWDGTAGRFGTGETVISMPANA